MIFILLHWELRFPGHCKLQSRFQLDQGRCVNTTAPLTTSPGEPRISDNQNLLTYLPREPRVCEHCRQCSHFCSKYRGWVRLADSRSDYSSFVTLRASTFQRRPSTFSHHNTSSSTLLTQLHGVLPLMTLGAANLCYINSNIPFALSGQSKDFVRHRTPLECKLACRAHLS